MLSRQNAVFTSISIRRSSAIQKSPKISDHDNHRYFSIVAITVPSTFPVKIPCHQHFPPSKSPTINILAHQNPLLINILAD
jgi:hypothetical protein